MPSPAITRALADVAATVTGEYAKLEGAVADLTAENVRLNKVATDAAAAGDLEPYVRGQTKLKEGRAYVVKDAGPLNVTVDVPCRIEGVPNVPVWAGSASPGFDLIAPAEIAGFLADCPAVAAPGKKLGIGPFVRDRAAGSRVTGCLVGNVDDFVFGELGSVGLDVAFTVQVKPVRGYCFYSQGAVGFVVRRNDWRKGAAVEQLIRCSLNQTEQPAPAFVSTSRNGLIFSNQLANVATADRPNPKGCIDLRAILGAVVFDNDIWGYPGGGSIAAGPKLDNITRPLRDWETADDGAIVKNRLHGGGMIQLRVLRSWTVSYNEVFDLRADVDNGISVTMKDDDGPRTIEDVDVIGNRLYVVGADTSNKPTVRKYGDTTPPIAGVYERANAFVRQAGT